MSEFYSNFNAEKSYTPFWRRMFSSLNKRPFKSQNKTTQPKHNEESFLSTDVVFDQMIEEFKNDFRCFMRGKYWLASREKKHSESSVQSDKIKSDNQLNSFSKSKNTKSKAEKKLTQGTFSMNYSKKNVSNNSNENYSGKTFSMSSFEKTSAKKNYTSSLSNSDGLSENVVESPKLKSSIKPDYQTPDVLEQKPLELEDAKKIIETIASLIQNSYENRNEYEKANITKEKMQDVIKILQENNIEKLTINDKEYNLIFDSSKATNQDDLLLNITDNVDIETGMGDDFVINYGNNLTISTQDGNDQVFANASELKIELGDGSDRFMGIVSDSYIQGQKGSDQMRAMAGSSNSIMEAGTGDKAGVEEKTSEIKVRILNDDRPTLEKVVQSYNSMEDFYKSVGLIDGKVDKSQLEASIEQFKKSGINIIKIAGKEYNLALEPDGKGYLKSPTVVDQAIVKNGIQYYWAQEPDENGGYKTPSTTQDTIFLATDNNVNTIYAANGNDILITDGVNVVNAGGGDDVIFASNAQRVEAREGDDTITAHNVSMWVDAQAGNDTLSGANIAKIKNLENDKTT